MDHGTTGIDVAGARAVVLIVLDSVGIGGAPDAGDFGDEGSATLPNLARAVGGVRLPGLGQLGLGNIVPVEGVDPVENPAGAYGCMIELSPGKDTTTGHWEIAGVVLDRPFPLYPEGFPAEVIEPFERVIGTGTLGNVAASGTEIIEQLGAEHMSSGKPIVYTSGDSVFQIAAHVDVVPLEQLYDMCRLARGLLRGPHEVGRVIARPFEGGPGRYARTSDRHDFSVPPPRDTVLDAITGAGLEVRAVGKISDIFGGRGVTSSHPTSSNEEGVDAILAELEELERGLVWANLVDFDQSYGHRNDAEGYAEALESFDRRLPSLLEALGPQDVLIVTADHGNDPTTPSTDHSRERVPVLCAGPVVAAGVALGTRASFADCGATVADLLGVGTSGPGTSWAQDMRPSARPPGFAEIVHKEPDKDSDL
ncbi:MAG: phosphopentomutase [Actinomycetota bacterium]|nr:phosphopentomutase [Actinomycetota bacterium]